MSNENLNPIVSIGLPVFNGEKSIHKTIEAILSQTLTNFELIISDNASTDNTSNICKEYEKKDRRVRYIRQEKNMGPWKNFNFVLKEAKCDYFMWNAADDQMSNNYLKSNLEVIKKTKNCIGSVGKTNYFGSLIEELEIISNDSLVKKINKKIRQWLASFFIDSFQGSYNEKIRMALKWTGAGLFIYGLFRTDVFKKSIPKEKFFALESVFLLNLIKHGDIILNNYTSMEKFVGKDVTSASGMFHLLKLYETNFLTRIFPLLPFTFWILKKYGIKTFLRNLDAILEWNFKMELFIGYAIINKLKERK
jgi:glycosyltransferase involved in cell wall biosynthesis